MTGPEHVPETPVATAPDSQIPRNQPPPEPAPAAAGEDLFPAKIAPMLAERCQPCHFPGGVMYEQLPFDRPETIRNLGSRLFSRIEDEEGRRWIREFLATRSPESPSEP